MEITESNKLIAEFMQIPKCKRCDDCGSHQYGPSIIFHPSEMQYQDLWSWLMPVVDKIESLGFSCTIMCDNCLIKNTHTYKKKIFRTSILGKTKIEATYTAIVEFIQWHKDNSK